MWGHGGEEPALSVAGTLFPTSSSQTWSFLCELEGLSVFFDYLESGGFGLFFLSLFFVSSFLGKGVIFRVRWF